MASPLAFTIPARFDHDSVEVARATDLYSPDRRFDDLQIPRTGIRTPSRPRSSRRGSVPGSSPADMMTVSSCDRPYVALRIRCLEPSGERILAGLIGGKIGPIIPSMRRAIPGDDRSTLALRRSEDRTSRAPDRLRRRRSRLSGLLGSSGPLRSPPRRTSRRPFLPQSRSRTKLRHRSVIIMSRIAGDDRLMFCFDTFT